MSAVKYQTMPPLSTEEYAQLEESILADGIQVPIIVDENGVVIDGHHRKAIAEHHGLHCPREVRSMLADAQKTALSISLNIARRQLTREQKRAIIEAAVKAQPELTDREHARRIGASPSTVGAVRADLEESGEVSKLDTRVDPRGYEQPAERPRPAPVETFDADGILVDAATGEVIEEPPTVTEHTVTEKVKTVTGLDGKQYKQKPRDPKLIPTGDEANRINAVQAAKGIGSALETLLGLTYESYQDRIITDWWPTGKHDVPPSQTELFTPSQLRHIAQGLTTTAAKLEAHHDQ